MPRSTPEPTEPLHLLTIAEYAELGEPKWGYTELIEGRLLMAPSPMPRHMVASGRLYRQLAEQLPEHLEAIQDVDINLELLPIDQPGYSRRPDLIVIKRDTLQRVETEGGMIRASEVLVVVEIASPGSYRIDNVDKRGEYADAGIPRYWIVDLDKPISMLVCHLTEEFGYMDDQTATGSFFTTDPFQVTLDLNQLR